MTTEPRMVRFGGSDVEFGEGKYLQPLAPKGALSRTRDFDAIRASLAADGYAYIDGAIPRDAVLAAREFILNDFASKGGILKAGTATTDAVLEERCGINCVPFMEGRNGLTHADLVRRVLEAAELKELFSGVFGSDGVTTFDYKWLRGVPNGSFTGAHYDIVYMGRGTAQLLTCWIPFDDITMDLGALAMCQGSHNGDQFSKLRDTYGAMDHERDRLDGTGWFSLDPHECTDLFGGQWRCTDYRAGDVMIFGMQTLHMSTTNTTDRVRVSCDVRWLPKGDAPDERYMGTFEPVVQSGAAKANKTDVDSGKQSIADLRKQWGFPVKDGVKLR